MFQKLLKILVSLILFLGGVYLLLPPPGELPPLPQSARSNEPGDTVQIPGVSAYYTDLSRKEILDFYTQNFQKSTFMGIPLITYRLNHPPEFARQLIRSTQQSSYLEEVVHPLRDSLYVSGYEWQNDPFTKPEKREKNKLVFQKREYKAKITIIAKYSNPFIRLGVGFFIVLLGIYLIQEFQAVFREVSRDVPIFRLPKRLLGKK